MSHYYSFTAHLLHSLGLQSGEGDRIEQYVKELIQLANMLPEIIGTRS